MVEKDKDMWAELALMTREELEAELRRPQIGMPLRECLPYLYSEKRRRKVMELLGAFDHEPSHGELQYGGGESDVGIQGDGD